MLPKRRKTNYVTPTLALASYRDMFWITTERAQWAQTLWEMEIRVQGVWSNRSCLEGVQEWKELHTNWAPEGHLTSDIVQIAAQTVILEGELNLRKSLLAGDRYQAAVQGASSLAELTGSLEFGVGQVATICRAKYQREEELHRFTEGCSQMCDGLLVTHGKRNYLRPEKQAPESHRQKILEAQDEE